MSVTWYQWAGVQPKALAPVHLQLGLESSPDPVASVGEGLSSPLFVVSETDLSELSGGTRRIALPECRSNSAGPCWRSQASVKALEAHHEQDTNPRDLHDPHIPPDSLSGKSTARYQHLKQPWTSS